MTTKPSMFVGSSVEGIGLAQAVQAELQHDVDVTLWNQNTFPVSKNTLESLIETSRSFDFGLFVFSPDDIAVIRRKRQLVVRDNVLFECGMFFGGLGRDRSFFLVPQGVKDFHIPSDLWGITPATYTPGSHGGNLQASVGVACTLIRQSIKNSLGAGNAQNLTGEWVQCWYSEGTSYPEKNETHVFVKQIGNKFSSKFEAKSIDSKRSLVYPIEGTLIGHYITGIWGEPRSGPTYHGSFQLYVHPGAEKMTGKWVGFRSNNEVYGEKWEWRRK